MKKFLKTICLFSLPLLLLCIGLEYSLRQVPNPFQFKRYLLEGKGKEIKNMIIGSSVVDYGIDPACLPDSTYNLAVSGQWFRYNKAQLEKYIDSLPHLRNVIWGIAYQALWEDEYEADVFLQDTKGEDDKIAYHTIYMDISFDNNWIHESELLSAGRLCFEKWSKHYLMHERTMYCDSLGLDHKYDLSEKEENKNKWLKAIPKSIKMHTALRNEKAESIYRQNIRRMHEVAELCHGRGVKLYLVVPPTYNLYHENIDEEQLHHMYSAIKSVADKWDNVSCHDYFKDKRFVEDDFFDGNHLTSDVGAVKFGRILRKDIFGGKERE